MYQAFTNTKIIFLWGSKVGLFSFYLWPRTLPYLWLLFEFHYNKGDEIVTLTFGLLSCNRCWPEFLRGSSLDRFSSLGLWHTGPTTLSLSCRATPVLLFIMSARRDNSSWQPDKEFLWFSQNTSAENCLFHSVIQF